MTAVAATAPAKEVLLIDLSAIFRAAWHANADGELSIAFQATLDGVRRCIGQRDALVAVCCDGKGNWRKELSPDYKIQREKQPASMYELLDRVKERLRADALLLWEVPGFEADDVIASACDAAVVAGHAVTICSHDKDLAQLLRPGVRFLKTSTWEEFDDVAMLSRFGVAANQLGDWLALVGDTSDNIRGVPGIGPKTATALLQKHGSVKGIWDSLAHDSIGTATPAIVRALQANIDTVELARKLVALRYDVPIDFDEIYKVRETKRLTKEDPDMDTDTDAEFAEAIISGPAPKTNGAVVATEEPRQQEMPAMAAAANNTALVAVNVPFEQALEPTHFKQAQTLSQVLHNSRLYPRLANDAQIFAIIVRGRELGLGALVALDVFSIVEGRLCASSHFKIAQAKAHRDCEYFQCIETTPTSATYETKNRNNPKPTRLTYTIEMAKTAGVYKPGGAWEKRGGEMCRKTCGSQLATVEYPDAALGLYSITEMGGDE